LSAFASATYAQAPAPTRYYLYDVGAVKGNPTVFRLNQNGAMVWNSGGHAFVYQNCQSRDLGHLGGGLSVARAINNNGVVVGTSREASGRMRAFSYANGTLHDLGGSASANVWEDATAVNFWGDVVGVESVLGTLSRTAVRYQSGVAARMASFFLTPPGQFLVVTDVVDLNDSSEVLGMIRTSFGTTAVRSPNLGNLWIKVNGVPQLDAVTTPSAMNRYGHVAGIAGNGFVRAFISTNPALAAIDLGTLGGALSMGLGINNYDRVVGWAEQTSGGGPRAFIHDGTTMTDLNTRLWNGTGWLLREAFAINDAGQIVGEGVFNNQVHAFFLQPMRFPPVFNPCGGVIGIGGAGSAPAIAR
jgi:probable HAF family extracellular repeat protein